MGSPTVNAERLERSARFLDTLVEQKKNPRTAEIADIADIPKKRGLRRTEETAEIAEIDALAMPPQPTEAMFYGVLGELAKEAANGSEVNPVAAMGSSMVWLSAAMGRNTGFSVGDGWHDLRLYGLHVGRSSRGGKGMSLDLWKRVRKSIENAEPGLCGHMHTGGLSSREGLALLIHDGFRDGKEDVPAIVDKRLLVVEEEFANVLNQAKRDGNTLSSVLRDAWDGSSIKPATKTSRIWASDPHIALHGCITPSELRMKMAKNELSNGFANRFLIFWSERTGSVPFPQRTPDDEVEKFAVRFSEIIKFGLAGYPGGDTQQCIKLDDHAAELYAELYRQYQQPHPSGELVTGLLERRAPMLRRMSALFAVTDRTIVIRREHIEAAAAWMDYYTQSVAYIFGPMVDAEGEAVRNTNAEKLTIFLVGKGWISRTDISNKCFKKRLTKEALSAALESLALAGRIERRSVDSGPRKRTDYRLLV